jgi:hypothetical protein
METNVAWQEVCLLTDGLNNKRKQNCARVCIESLTALSRSEESLKKKNQSFHKSLYDHRQEHMGDIYRVLQTNKKSKEINN